MNVGFGESNPSGIYGTVVLGWRLFWSATSLCSFPLDQITDRSINQAILMIEPALLCPSPESQAAQQQMPIAHSQQVLIGFLRCVPKDGDFYEWTLAPQ